MRYLWGWYSRSAIVVLVVGSMLAVVLWQISAQGTLIQTEADVVAKKDREKLQGTWSIVELVADGEQAPAEITDILKLVFKDDRLIFAPGEHGFTNYTYKLDTTTKPASFDMIHADGESKGEVKKGIYSWDGDRLKICFGIADDRPTEFSAKSDSGRALYLLKPVKP